MSLIETNIPQKSKTYSERSQDHGSNSQGKEKRGAVGDDWAHHNKSKQDAKWAEAAILEATEKPFSAFTSDQLEDAADALLGETMREYKTETPTKQSGETTDFIDGQDEESLPQDNDRFFTETELGLKSKHEIRKALAQRATSDYEIDVELIDESDYHVPVHIVNNPK